MFIINISEMELIDISKKRQDISIHQMLFYYFSGQSRITKDTEIKVSI